MKENELAINGGKPVRKAPLPLEFPGVHHMDSKEVQAAVRVLKSRSLFRYYGVKLQKEVEKLEAEFAQRVGTKYAIGVTAARAPCTPLCQRWAWGPGRKLLSRPTCGSRYWRRS